MKPSDKIKNIMAFVTIMRNAETIPPDYLMEKFERYCMSGILQHEWGMHPLLKRHLEEWCEIYKEQLEEIDK